MKRLTPTHTQLKLARPPPARARGSPHPLSADIARPARVEKKVLMSHKISIFQLVSIVKFYICAGTRSAGFLDGAQEVNFCQKRPKNLDISPFFSTRARQLNTSNPPRPLAASGACGEELLQEMPKEFQASYQAPQLRKLPWGLPFVEACAHVFLRRAQALLQELRVL